METKNYRSRVVFGVKSVGQFVEVHGEVEIEDDQTEGIGPQIKLDLGTGFDPVLDLGEELFPEIEDHPRDLFEKVRDIDLNEEEQTPTKPVPNLTGEE